MYDEMGGEYHDHQYNLYSVYKKVITEETIPKDLKEEWNRIRTKFDNVANEKAYAYYFVLYQQGSRVSMHFDTTPISMITMIEKDSLVGGENIIIDQDTGEAVEFSFDVGETAIYSNYTYHGLSYVDEGYRLVLVSWYGEPARK